MQGCSGGGDAGLRWYGPPVTSIRGSGGLKELQRDRAGGGPQQRFTPPPAMAHMTSKEGRGGNDKKHCTPCPLCIVGGTDSATLQAQVSSHGHDDAMRVLCNLAERISYRMKTGTASRPAVDRQGGDPSGAPRFHTIVNERTYYLCWHAALWQWEPHTDVRSTCAFQRPFAPS